MDLNVNSFQVFNSDWALVTAGTEGDYNTMTISWGGLGTLWGKPVATVYAKPIRYTHRFLDANDYFTVSFFPDEKSRADRRGFPRLNRGLSPWCRRQRPFRWPGSGPNSRRHPPG